MNSSQTTIEPFYVVDTNALIWRRTDNRRLGRQAARIFDAAEHGETRLLIPSIVMAELYFADKKYHLFTNFAVIFQHLQSLPYIRFVSFEADHVLDFDLDTPIPEMHDRIITGLARRLHDPLLTSDSKITRANLAVVIWE